MRPFSIPLGLALAAFALLATVTPASATERPFRADGEVVNNGSGYVVEFGTASQLGRFNLWLDLSYDPFAYELTLPRAWFRSADGENLYMTGGLLDSDLSTGIAVGRLTINGGTGRFQNATGAVDVLLVFDDASLRQFDFLVDGTIDY